MDEYAQAVRRAATTASLTLRTNHRVGVADGRAYDFTCPSPGSYPFQWAWDSSFIAIALRHVDPGRAQAELSSLAQGLTGTGFLPHMLLWQQELRARATQEFRIALWDGWTSVTLAPPVFARAVEAVYRTTGDEDWLTGILPAVQAFFTWLHHHRRTAQGLLAIYQPDESGLDISPKYDRALGIAAAGADVRRAWHAAMSSLLEAYRDARTPESELGAKARFAWVDVLFNTVYADGLASLARLLAQRDPQAARRFDERNAETVSALLEHCWDEQSGAFYDLNLVAGTRETTLTVSSLMPLVLDRVPAPIAARLVDEHLTNEREFWLPYPVPSVAATEPSFDPDFATGAIFRGSSWINLNWYLAWGLQERGFTDVAEELIRRTVAMAARSGMRECYGPYDAAGQGAESFGWSTLVLDLIPDLIPDLVHTGQAAARARAGEDFVVHCDAASARSARSMEPSS